MTTKYMTLAGQQIQVLQEQSTNTVNVTSYPTEKGLPITDNTQRQPKTWSLTAKIFSRSGKSDTDARRTYAMLEKAQNNGTMVSYTGRMSAANVVISEMDVTNDSTVGNGMQVTINLQEIRIANDPRVVQQSAKKPSGKKAVKKSTAHAKSTPKKYHKIVKNDTYWALARRYGTTVKRLESLNPWPARFLPIGGMMRIS